MKGHLYSQIWMNFWKKHQNDDGDHDHDGDQNDHCNYGGDNDDGG